METPELQDLPGSLWMPARGFANPELRLLAAALAVLLLLALRPAGAAVLGLPAFLIACSRPGGRRRSFIFLAFGIAMLTVGLNAFTEPGAVLLRMGPLTVTGSGLVRGAERAVRLIGLMAVGRLALSGFAAEALSDLVQRMSWPLERRVAALGGFGLTLGLGIRFLPEVLEEATQIRLARRARPPRPAIRGLGGRLEVVESLFLPMLAATVRRAEEVALTLDARAFASGPRTRRMAAESGPLERWLAVALVVGTGLILVADRLR